jgi:uncharacterized protein YqhQ
MPDITPNQQKLPLRLFLLTLAGSLGLGLVLFVAVPFYVTSWLPGAWKENALAFALVEGAIKLAIFIAYVYLIGLRPDIRRIFEYHGAEHKVVYAAENHLPITPASARPFDTPHPRCGTGFALLTVVVSILCFTIPPLLTDVRLYEFLLRLAFLPIVAGVSYEILKLTVHPRFGWLAKIVMTPGMWLQRLTTRQPDDSQLEVSCAAMQAVLDAERNTRGVAKPGVI